MAVETTTIIMRKNSMKFGMRSSSLIKRLMKIRMMGNTSTLILSSDMHRPVKERKGAFNDELQAELEDIPGHEKKLLIGVTNAILFEDSTK